MSQNLKKKESELQGHGAHGGIYNRDKAPHFAALQRERCKHVTFPPLPPTSSGDTRLKKHIKDLSS
jgi:hypothetical protein